MAEPWDGSAGGVVILFFIVFIVLTVIKVAAFLLSVWKWLVVLVCFYLLLIGSLFFYDSFHFLLRGASVALLSFLGWLLRLVSARK